MTEKIMKVFYDANGLPYKDKVRQVHYPLVGSAFMGSSNTTQIRFYVGLLGNSNDTWVSCAKLPNGQLGYKMLSATYDSEESEYYVSLSLTTFYTQYKGDVYIALQGYQSGVSIQETSVGSGIYKVVGTPTIQATGVIKLAMNYTPQISPSALSEDITAEDIQEFLSAISTGIGSVIPKINTSNIASYEFDDNLFHENEIVFNDYDNQFYQLKLDNNSVLVAVYMGNTQNTPYFTFNASGDKTIGDLYTEYLKHSNNQSNMPMTVKLTNLGSNAGNTLVGTIVMSLDTSIYHIEFERLSSGHRAGKDRWSCNDLVGGELIKNIFALYNEYYIPYFQERYFAFDDTTTLQELYDEIGNLPLVLDLIYNGSETSVYSGFFLTKLSSGTNFVGFELEKISADNNADRRWYGGATPTTLLKDVLTNSSAYYHPYSLDEDVVHKTTSANKVYGTDNSGNQTTLNYGTEPSASSIVQRDVNGGVVVNLTPISNNYATSKKYVDDRISDALTGAYKVQGSKTVSELNIIAKGEYLNGYVYNITNNGNINNYSGTTSVVAGDNVVFVWNGGSWYWDKLAGTIDTSNFVLKSTTIAGNNLSANISSATLTDSLVFATNSDIDNLFE